MTMPPTYALIGATGTIGGYVLSHLIRETEYTIHAFVRSQDKLTTQLETSDLRPSPPSRLRIFSGSVSDIKGLQSCITGVDAVFLCAAASENKPGCRIAQDQAEATVSALQNIRKENRNAKMPRLVMLSSAETSGKFSAEIPWPIRDMLFASNSNIYNDLIAAEQYLRKQEAWVSTVFAKPGGLSHDIKRGHQMSLDHQQTWLSFADLAAGMVETADVDGERWEGKDVSVLSPADKAKFMWTALPVLFRGLILHFFPGVYGYI